MKNTQKKLAVMFGAIALLSTVSINANADTVEGGTIKFLGSVVNAACAVDAGDVDKVVKMGQVRLADFGSTAGTLSKNRHDVDIKLLDCDTSVSTTAAVTFNGTGAGGAFTKVLQAGLGAGSATGVGIQLFDSTGSKLDLGVAATPTTLIDGTNVLHYQAAYISTEANPTAGNADANATFTITYA